MEKEKSSPYTFFILRYRLVNLQGGIFAFEKEKNYGRRKYEYNSYNRKTKSTGNHRQAGGRIKGTFLRVKSTRLIFPPCQNFIITALTTLYLSPCKSRKQHL